MVCGRRTVSCVRSRRWNSSGLCSSVCDDGRRHAACTAQHSGSRQASPGLCSLLLCVTIQPTTSFFSCTDTVLFSRLRDWVAWHCIHCTNSGLRKATGDDTTSDCAVQLFPLVVNLAVPCAGRNLIQRRCSSSTQWRTAKRVGFGGMAPEDQWRNHACADAML